MTDTNRTLSLATPIIVLTAAAASLTAGPAAAMNITPKSQVVIVLPANSTPAEKTAAEELKHYLPAVTQAQVSIAAESQVGPAGKERILISVGKTDLARKAGIKAEAFSMDEWLMRFNQKTLYLIGHGTRGTLYATYHFLEDKAGVRWWTPWEEFVPRNKTLSLRGLNKKGKPVFDYRDIYSVYGNDGGRFAIRNRLNRDGDTPIDAKFGGGRDYGPPYHVHTSYSILSPKKYYKDHPDWFLGNGTSEPDSHNSQLAMSNPAMRQEFLRLLREIIRTSRAKALANNLPAPDVFNVSQEDNTVSFKGPGDEKLLAENGGAESAIVLDFINFLADSVKAEFPDVYIDTLAYHSGEKAPTKIKPRDNVTIRLTDTKSNLVAPITAPENHIFHDNIVNWGKITKNLRVWDYAITYVYPGLPTPTIHTYPADLKFWAEHNVKGIFVEHEYEVRADMRDLKIWLQCKMFEDPYQNQNALIKEFTDGYYGAAGTFVRRYLTLLEESSRKNSTHLSWFASPGAHTHISVDFIQQANAIFDQAAAAIAGNKALERRVAHARLPLDRAITARYELLTRKWALDGNKPEAFPLDKNAALERYQRTWAEQIDFRMAEW